MTELPKLMQFRRRPMSDLFYLALGLGVLALLALYARGLARI